MCFHTHNLLSGYQFGKHHCVLVERELIKTWLNIKLTFCPTLRLAVAVSVIPANVDSTNQTSHTGHGISIGSIASDKVVSGVTIENNVVTDSVNGLRIKTDYGATDASGEDVY